LSSQETLRADSEDVVKCTPGKDSPSHRSAPGEKFSSHELHKEDTGFTKPDTYCTHVSSDDFRFESFSIAPSSKDREGKVGCCIRDSDDEESSPLSFCTEEYSQACDDKDSVSIEGLLVFDGNESDEQEGDTLLVYAFSSHEALHTDSEDIEKGRLTKDFPSGGPATQQDSSSDETYDGDTGCVKSHTCVPGDCTSMHPSSMSGDDDDIDSTDSSSEITITPFFEENVECVVPWDALFNEDSALANSDIISFSFTVKSSLNSSFLFLYLLARVRFFFFFEYLLLFLSH
jgi:hypothetical protein